MCREQLRLALIVEATKLFIGLTRNADVKICSVTRFGDGLGIALTSKKVAGFMIGQILAVTQCSASAHRTLWSIDNFGLIISIACFEFHDYNSKLRLIDLSDMCPCPV